MRTAAAQTSRDAQKTRERILEAAKMAFSRDGYGETGVREIASAAGVDPVLIRRYFGSKAGLLEAALISNLHSGSFSEDPAATRGFNADNIINRILNNDTNIVFPIATLAAKDREAKQVGRKVLQEYILPPLAKRLGGPDALERATILFILTSGLLLHVRKADRDDSQAAPELVLDWFRDAIQALIDNHRPARERDP